MSNVKVIEVRCTHISRHTDVTTHKFASFPNEVPNKLDVCLGSLSAPFYGYGYESCWNQYGHTNYQPY